MVTAEEGSLSAAARALGMSQPTLGRQVDALEAELGVTLFERVGRRLALTDAGAELLTHARAMGEAASHMSMAASSQSSALEGAVTISASEAFAAHILPDILSTLRRTEPGIHVEVLGTNAPSDLIRREADIAVRNVRPDHPDLIAKKIRDMDGHFYAATSYLDRVGRPNTLEALSACDFIGFDRTDQMLELLRGMGVNVTQRNFPIVSGNHLVQWEMVKQGLGIGVMAEAVGRMTPGVEPVSDALPPVAFGVWLVSHRELHTSGRVRVVFDLLAEALEAL